MRRLLLGLLTLAAVGAATESAFAASGNAYDNRQTHNEVCATPRNPTAVPLRYADGAPETTLDAAALRYTSGSTRSRGTTSAKCKRGQLHLDVKDALSSPAGPLYLFRGGNGVTMPSGAVSYGHVSANDLRNPPRVNRAARGANGRKPGSCAGKSWRVVPQDIGDPGQDQRKPGGPSWSSYGDPGKAYGRPGSYQYVLWSWLDQSGGGMVRALVRPDQVVQECAQVPRARQPIYRGSAVVGEAYAVYVRFSTGPATVWGWIPYKWRYTGQPFHVMVTGP